LAAVAAVSTIGYVADILGEYEDWVDWLRDLSIDRFPEDGRAPAWSSAPSPDLDETGVSRKASRTLPKPRSPSSLSPPSSLLSGGLLGRRS
jgi:hypothetical protein